MPNLIITVQAEDGTPINGAWFTLGQYNTTPCPFGSIGCTSESGGVWSPSDTNAAGQSISNIPFTCKQQWTAILNATGFVTQNFAYSSGYVTGDCKVTVTMTADNNGANAGNNKGDNAGAGSVGQQVGEGTAATASNVSTNASDWLSTYWWLILLFAIIAVILILAVHHKSGAPVKVT